MSNTKSRRMNQFVRIDKLLQQNPNVEKTFQYVHVIRKDGAEYPLKATYPILTKEAKRMTIAAYHIYVEGYNKKVNSERIKIRKHNAALKKITDKSNPPNLIRTQRHFANCHGTKNVWEYNELAFQYNQKFGQLIPLKLPQTIKQSTEKIFTTLLWAYSDQLLKLKKGKVASNITPYRREVNTMEINTKHLENIKGDMGLFMLNCCPDTMLNHKNRLIEAGVLVNNSFHSSNRGTMHHICPEILVVFDDFEKHFVFAENQVLNICKPEVFRDVFIPTRAINQPTIKRVVDNNSIGKKHAKDSSSPDEVQAAFLSSTNFPSEKTGADLSAITGAPRMKQNPPEIQKTESKSKEKAENSAKKDLQNGTETEHSKYLRSLLVLWNVFAQQLAAKDFEKYKPLDYAILKHEAMNGTMTREEFRELLITELFKSFSKIYADHPYFQIVFAGEWYTTIKLWLLSNRFMGGDGNPLCKDIALQHYRKLLFAFSDTSFGAFPVARRSKFVAPRASIFLDPDLKTPGTFMHHYKKVEKNSTKKVQAENKLRAKKKKKAQANTEYSNNLRKLNRAIAQWYNSGGDYSKLYNYSFNNMPSALHADLAKHIENYFLSRNPEKLTA